MRSLRPSNRWAARSIASTTPLGTRDVLGVFDIPDQANAAALSLMINSTGAVNLHLKPLMTPEDIDEAAKKTPSYRAPGQ